MVWCLVLSTPETVPFFFRSLLLHLPSLYLSFEYNYIASLLIIALIILNQHNLYYFYLVLLFPHLALLITFDLSPSRILVTLLLPCIYTLIHFPASSFHYYYFIVVIKKNNDNWAIRLSLLY